MLKHCKFIFREGNLMNRLTGGEMEGSLERIASEPVRRSQKTFNNQKGQKHLKVRRGQKTFNNQKGKKHLKVRRVQQHLIIRKAKNIQLSEQAKKHLIIRKAKNT